MNSFLVRVNYINRNVSQHEKYNGMELRCIRIAFLKEALGISYKRATKLNETMVNNLDVLIRVDAEQLGNLFGLRYTIAKEYSISSTLILKCPFALELLEPLEIDETLELRPGLRTTP